MRPRTPERLALAFVLALIASGAARPRVDHTSLQARLAHLAAMAPGVVGVSAVHLESGRTVGVRADAQFPMQSTFKLPVALVVLDAIDHRKLALEQRVHLFRWDMQPSGSAITDQHPRGDVDVSVHDLLEAMILHSDNTASDALLPKVGGPAGVTAWLRAHGFTAIRVDRPERRLGDDWYGLTTHMPDSLYTAARLRAAREAVPAAQRTRADEAFPRDPRDHASPAAFTAILAQLQQRRLLCAASTDTLLAMMGRCATGAARLPALLPPGTRLAHKTGTAGTWRGHTHAINDVGILTLPGGGGHVAIAVLVRDVHGDPGGAERSIARIAREVFDAWNAPE
jgi:beta-lactamase class A